MSFTGGLRCYVHIKGPEPKGHSSLEDIRRLLARRPRAACR